MIEGHLIVLEGIDGAGTTTQTARLAQTLRARGLAVHTTREPSDGPFGVMIRQVLTGRLVVPGSSGVPHAPSWATMALLFAADRVDHLEAEVLPNLHDGVTVVSDRYVPSSVGYQGASTDDPTVVPWLLEINRQARAPDLTIVLDVSSEVALRRRQARAGRAELYEEEALQRRLAAFYREVDKHFPGQRFAHIDGDRDADAVHADVVAAVDALRAQG